MSINELTQNLKTAFEYKNKGEYKQAIDYFYKALAFDSESTQIMIELAELYSNLCRYERSISFYEQILQRTPYDDEIKYKLANLLKKNKDYKKSEEIFLKLYESGYNIEETAPELFFLLMYHKKYGKIIMSYNKYAKELKSSKILYFVALAHAELGNKNTAEEFFKKSFENDKNNTLAGIEIVSRLYRRGQNQDAVELAKTLLKYRENAEIYYLLAEIENSQGNIDSAIKYYSFAIKVNPQSANYYFKLGITFSLKGFFKEAEESYCKAINLDSDNEIYNYALAYMYYITKKYDLSEKITDTILERNPDNIKANALKILIMIENNKNQFCAKLVEKIEKENRKDDFTLYALSIYYAGLGLWEKAKNAILKALNYNRNSLEYKYQLARFQYELGQIKDSEAICEKIIEENPKYIQGYLILSKIKYKKNDYDRAETLLKKVIELDKNQYDIYELWGDIYKNRKEYRLATDKYKIALTMKPDNEINYAKIGECLYNQGAYDDAYIYYKEASEINITDAKYRYYMAKCSEKLGNREEAISNYSVAKRLDPYKIEYIKDYSIFLNSIGKKSDAVKMLKIKKNELQKEEEITELNELIKELKA